MIVRTVLGDVVPESLGTVDYHEHLFQVTPLLAGDGIDSESASTEEARLIHEAGIDTLVEATPAGLAPRPAAVARVALATGLHIVHTTGLHHSGHYAPGDPLLSASAESLGERFTRDVEHGLLDSGVPALAPDGTAVRAGLVKAGARYWRLGPFERRALAAATAVQRSTGCAVMVHLDHGSAAHEVLDLLAEGGVPADRVVLAHADRNLDPGLHADLIARGAYLGYDGMARSREAPDSAILDCLARVVERAGAERIVLGGDVARSSRYTAYGGMPGLAYLPERFLPRVAALVDEPGFRLLSGGNAARLLAFEPQPA